MVHSETPFSRLRESLAEVNIHLAALDHYLMEKVKRPRKEVLFSSCEGALRAYVFLFKKKLLRGIDLRWVYDSALEDYLWLLEQLVAEPQPQERIEAIWHHAHKLLSQVDDLLVYYHVPQVKEKYCGYSSLRVRLVNTLFFSGLVWTDDQKEQLRNRFGHL
jgi:hypothetical protein